MKTSKTTGKSKETSKSAKTVKTRKVTNKKAWPSEDEIRQKAMEIYHQRADKGEHGSPESDWHQAEEYFKKLRD